MVRTVNSPTESFETGISDACFKFRQSKTNRLIRMSLSSFFRGAAGEPINKNWSNHGSSRVGNFSEGVTEARKSRKNARFQGFRTRKFRGSDVKPIELINMATHAYGELSKARKTIHDPSMRLKIKDFMQALRKDIRTHLEVIHYRADEEKHKSELIAYNDFLYTYYLGKDDNVVLTQTELDTIMAETAARSVGRTPAERSRFLVADKEFTRTRIEETRQRIAREIITVWCIQVSSYRKENPHIFLEIPHSAATLALCSDILTNLPPPAAVANAAVNAAVNAAAPAASSVAGGRSRKMKRSKRI
jgi:hypothetical protein